MSDSPVWYVVFMDSDTDGWWKRFTEPGFEHVCCFAQCPSGVVLSNYKFGRTEMSHFDGWDVDDFATAIKQEGKTVLRVQSQIHEDNYFRVLHYCVPLVKSCIGVRSNLILTPKQLFNYLVKQDYVERV